MRSQGSRARLILTINRCGLSSISFWRGLLAFLAANFLGSGAEPHFRNRNLVSIPRNLVSIVACSLFRVFYNSFFWFTQTFDFVHSPTRERNTERVRERAQQRAGRGRVYLNREVRAHSYLCRPSRDALHIAWAPLHRVFALVS